MIFETVVCDYCGEAHLGPTVPDKWVSVDGQHFDTKWCAITYWENYENAQPIRGI